MIGPARLAAYRVLRDVHGRDRLLPDALAAVARGTTDARDRALAAEIATGTLRWRAAVDHVIARTARRAIGDLDPEVLDVLRSAVYQLLHLDRVPASAVVDDAVELTREVRKRQAAGLVNAVLRRVSGDPAARALPPRPHDADGDPALRSQGAREAALEYLSVTLSHPEWLAGRWLDRVGFAAAERWCQFDNSHAPLTLRANTTRIDRDTLARRLDAAGVLTAPTSTAPHGLVVRAGHPLRDAITDEGLFVVQEEPSQLVCEVAAVQAGWRVLDACASPGGKTVAFAGALGGTGLLVAADVRTRRVRLLRATLQRALDRPVPLVHADMERGAPFAAGSFDCVFVDAPCSGLGTIRRDPDIRWRRTPEDLPRMARRQLALLASAADAVRPGGRLVYATCSSEPEENDAVVEGFLARHPDAFSRVDLRKDPAVAPFRAVIDAQGFLRTLPHAHGLEAFFAAALRRHA